MSVDELEQAIREQLVRLQVKVAYRSLVSETGIALIGIRDVVSSSIELAGIFSGVTQALVWIENGAGASFGVALEETGEGLKLNFADEFEITLEGGITPETMVRIALSELDYAAEICFTPASPAASGLSSSLVRRRRSPLPCAMFPGGRDGRNCGNGSRRINPWLSP